MIQGWLDEIVFLYNVVMFDCMVLEWDKEDIDVLGLMKVDVLGLGMLICVVCVMDMICMVYKCFMQVSDILLEDVVVYDMICKVDMVGVFQIESCVQMIMLLWFKFCNFYDLVIEVVIVCFGFIQGDMVYFYFCCCDGLEVVEFFLDELEQVLGKILGVLFFQEQVMCIVIVVVGFMFVEFDKFCCFMVVFWWFGIIYEMGCKLVFGMIVNGYEVDFVECCFK